MKGRLRKRKVCSASSGSTKGTNLAKAKELWCGRRGIKTGVLGVNKLWIVYNEI
jgi:hypothetical protein